MIDDNTSDQILKMARAILTDMVGLQDEVNEIKEFIARIEAQLNLIG